MSCRLRTKNHKGVDVAPLRRRGPPVAVESSVEANKGVFNEVVDPVYVENRCRLAKIQTVFLNHNDYHRPGERSDKNSWGMNPMSGVIVEWNGVCDPSSQFRKTCVFESMSSEPVKTSANRGTASRKIQSPRPIPVTKPA